MTADDIFAETADAESLVGYYLYWYKDEALKVWTENITRKYCNTNDEIMKIILATTKTLDILQGSDTKELKSIQNDWVKMSIETELEDKSFGLVLTKDHLVPRFCQYREKGIFLFFFLGVNTP